MEHCIPKNKTEPKNRAENVRDARVRRSRAALRQALLDLLGTLPWERITVRDIAKRAGVGYTTYFRHYPNKHGLLDDLAAEEMAALTAFTAPVYMAVDSRAACVALCQFVDSHRPLWSALLTGGAGATVRQELLRQGRMTVSKLDDSWLPSDLALALAVSAIVELLDWWLRQPQPFPVDRIAEIMDAVAIAPTEPRRLG
jgi:AcrR family transcriptional regulator